MKQTQEARKAIIEAVDARKNAAEKKKLLDEQTYGTLETKVISVCIPFLNDHLQKRLLTLKNTRFFTIYYRKFSFFVATLLDDIVH